MPYKDKMNFTLMSTGYNTSRYKYSGCITGEKCGKYSELNSSYIEKTKLNGHIKHKIIPLSMKSNLKGPQSLSKVQKYHDRS